jgi:hypothetical protein
MGMKPCTIDDMKDPNGALLCFFLGGFPIERTFESQVISATIQAGNSGSAVYNNNGEVAGLVFAGSGDLSYALIVPQEYIENFIRNELSHLPKYKPMTEVTLSTKDFMTKLKSACYRIQLGDTSPTLEAVRPYCKSVNDMLQ